MPRLSAADLTPYDPFAGMRFGPKPVFSPANPLVPPIPFLSLPTGCKRRYHLVGRPILLLDQSTTTFAELQLPASPAARRRVAALESQVEAAAAQGPAALRALPAETLFLWLGKMFYGIFITELFKEQEPLMKPRYPLAENAALLRRFQAFFLLLQGLRVPADYADFVPASVFVLEVAPQADPPGFEYDDDLSTLVFSIKLGNSVVVACLADIGLVGQAMRRVYADAQRPFTPGAGGRVQARVYYAAHLLNVVPDIYPAPRSPATTRWCSMPCSTTSARRCSTPWENAAYAQALAELWQRWHLTPSEINADSTRPLSLLYDAETQPRPG